MSHQSRFRRRQHRRATEHAVPFSEVADLEELFGEGRPYVTTPDGIAHIGQVGQTQWDDTKRWHAHVEHWDGHVVYDGPAPVPLGIATLSLDELAEGKSYTFTMTPIDG